MRSGKFTLMFFIDHSLCVLTEAGWSTACNDVFSIFRSSSTEEVDICSVYVYIYVYFVYLLCFVPVEVHINI